MQRMAWGKQVVLHMFPENYSQKNVHKYFETIEASLHKFGITDEKIKLVAYSTIRAETASFKPIKEHKSKYNTMEKHIAQDYGNKNINDISAVTGKLIKKYGLSDDYGLYNYRKDIGNSNIGHGEKYCGRGFIQLTGMENYRNYGSKIGKDLVENPDLALDPNIAADILAAFIADAKQTIILAITGRWHRATPPRTAESDTGASGCCTPDRTRHKDRSDPAGKTCRTDA